MKGSKMSEYEWEAELNKKRSELDNYSIMSEVQLLLEQSGLNDLCLLGLVIANHEQAQGAIVESKTYERVRFTGLALADIAGDILSDAESMYNDFTDEDLVKMLEKAKNFTS